MKKRNYFLFILIVLLIINFSINIFSEGLTPEQNSQWDKLCPNVEKPISLTGEFQIDSVKEMASLIKENPACFNFLTSLTDSIKTVLNNFLDGGATMDVSQITKVRDAKLSTKETVTIGRNKFATGTTAEGFSFSDGKTNAKSISFGSEGFDVGGSTKLTGSVTNFKQSTGITTGVAGEGVTINGQAISAGDTFTIGSDGKLKELTPAQAGETDLGALQKNGLVSEGAKISSGNVKINGVDYNIQGEIKFQGGEWVTTSGTNSINGWTNLQSGKTIGVGKNYEFTSNSLTVRGTTSDTSAYNSVLDKTLYSGKNSVATIEYNSGQITAGVYSGENAGLYAGQTLTPDNFLDGVFGGKAQRGPDFQNYVKNGEISSAYDSNSNELLTKLNGQQASYTNPKGKQAESVVKKISNLASKAVGLPENAAEKTNGLLSTPEGVQKLMELFKGLGGGGDKKSSSGESSSSEENPEEDKAPIKYSETTTSSNEIICTKSPNCGKDKICSAGICIDTIKTA